MMQGLLDSYDRMPASASPDAVQEYIRRMQANPMQARVIAPPPPPPQPMALKPMATVDPSMGAGKGMTDAQRMAMSKAAGQLGPGGGVQAVAQAAVPLLDAWRKKRQLAGQGSILSGLLGK